MCTSVNCLTYIHIYSGHDVKLHLHRVRLYISNRLCGIWLGISEGANVIISK